MKYNRGFTLIELVAVIVLLGILAVTALPRFVDLSSDARRATNSAVASTLDAAIRGANLKWIVNGSPGRIQNLQGFSDGQLDLSTNGWPIGIDKGNGNDNIGRQNKGCFELWNYLILDGPRAAEDTSADYQSYRHSGNVQCSFVLRTGGDTADRANAQLGVLYNSTTGSVEACGQLVGNSC